MEGISSSLDELVAQEAISILLALLPGLIAVEIVYSLTVRERKSLPERVIEALIYTFLVYVTWSIASAINRGYLALGLPAWFHRQSKPGAADTLIALGACAVVVGLVMTAVINKGFIHCALRKIRLTNKGSNPDNWSKAFDATLGNRYIVAHLKDGLRVYGWPALWPDRPKAGEFLLIRGAQWLDDQGDASPIIEELLLDASCVTHVEFIPKEPPGGAPEFRRIDDVPRAGTEPISSRPHGTAEASPGGSEQG